MVNALYEASPRCWAKKKGLLSKHIAGEPVELRALTESAMMIAAVIAHAVV